MLQECSHKNARELNLFLIFLFYYLKEQGGVDIRDICSSKICRIHVFLGKKLKIISEKLVGLEWSKKQGGICNQMIKLNKIYWSGVVDHPTCKQEFLSTL